MFRIMDQNSSRYSILGVAAKITMINYDAWIWHSTSVPVAIRIRVRDTARYGWDTAHNLRIRQTLKLSPFCVAKRRKIWALCSWKKCKGRWRWEGRGREEERERKKKWRREGATCAHVRCCHCPPLPPFASLFFSSSSSFLSSLLALFLLFSFRWRAKSHRKKAFY